MIAEDSENPNSQLYMSKWIHGETHKLKELRLREGWFEKYAPENKSGIDIGPADDPLNTMFRRYEMHDGDATYMKNINDNAYQTVYASHILEHIEDVETALKNWYRICKPGGHLIVVVPDRDLYEKKAQPPSSWNGAHKWFFLPEFSIPPRVLGLKQLISDVLPDLEMVSFKEYHDGYIMYPPNIHPVGNYSIEYIGKKP